VLTASSSSKSDFRSSERWRQSAASPAKEQAMYVPHSAFVATPSYSASAHLAKFEPTYLGKRQVKLQFWLKSVLLHPELGAHEAVRRFVVDL
jgi:hypothetical protein